MDATTHRHTSQQLEGRLADQGGRVLQLLLAVVNHRYYNNKSYRLNVLKANSHRKMLKSYFGNLSCTLVLSYCLFNPITKHEVVNLSSYMYVK